MNANRAVAVQKYSYPGRGYLGHKGTLRNSGNAVRLDLGTVCKNSCTYNLWAFVYICGMSIQSLY